VAHGMAALTPVGRRLVVDRVLRDGWPAATVAEAMGVSRATVSKWVRRFCEEGVEGLEDRSSRPGSYPRAVSPQVVRRVVMLRVRRRWGPHRISWVTGIPRSTVYKVLCRVGLNRLDRIDRTTRRPIRRYERSRPGELLHIDVKKLARIPDGGGWKIRGRNRHTKTAKNRGVGYDYLHVAVDDHSRVAYVEAHPNDKDTTAAGFLDRVTEWFSDHGVTVSEVLTDNAFCYRHSQAFHNTADNHGITRHRTRPYRPQTNGKAERFNRTLLEEWAYHQAYTSNQQRLDRLTRWLDTHNQCRPHGGLGGHPPATRLKQPPWELHLDGGDLDSLQSRDRQHRNGELPGDVDGNHHPAGQPLPDQVSLLGVGHRGGHLGPSLIAVGGVDGVKGWWSTRSPGAGELRGLDDGAAVRAFGANGAGLVEGAPNAAALYSAPQCRMAITYPGCLLEAAAAGELLDLGHEGIEEQRRVVLHPGYKPIHHLPVPGLGEGAVAGTQGHTELGIGAWGITSSRSSRAAAHRQRVPDGLDNEPGTAPASKRAEVEDSFGPG